MVDMRRANYQPTTPCEHTGLFLDKGFEHWHDQNHNQDITKHHRKAAKIACSELYKQAYKRWRDYQCESDHSGVWFGKLENRLYVGLGEFSPLEAGITLQRTYGVPFISGSAVKGRLHHYAMEAGVEPRIRELLFGKEASPTDKTDSGKAAYVIFNDAWWIPQGRQRALVPETITTHHPDYYRSGGQKPATDFDSPNPNPQIAIQGSFMFSVEGDASLVQFVMSLLEKALSERGIGAKSSSGYGYFAEDVAETKHFNEDKVLIPQKIKRQAEEKLRQAEAIKEAQAEAEKLSKLTPFEQGIYQQIKGANAPAIDLLKRLDANEWSDAQQIIAVASIVKVLLQESSQWRPDFTGGNKAKLKQKERSVQTLKYLRGEP